MCGVKCEGWGVVHKRERRGAHESLGWCVGGRGAGGVGGAAVHLPPIIAPFIEAMAASASSQVEKETKPKPLEMPVSCRG